jgi:hypothetical protein
LTAVATPDYSEGYDDAIVMPSALNVALGVWLVFAPFLLSYGRGDRLINEVACGAVIALLGYLRAQRAARSPLLSWVNVLLGAWMVVSGALFAVTPAAAVNQAISGGVVCLLAFSSAVVARD